MSVLTDILRRLTKLEREALRFRKATVVETNTLEAEFGGADEAQPTVVIDGIDVDDNDVVTAIGNSRNTLILGRTVDSPNPAAGGGASVGSSVGSTIQPDDAAAAGSAATAARSDHKHAIVAATASTIDGVNAEGSSTSFARADHNHALGTGVVTTTQILDGTIATGDLADGAVTSAKIADGTIANADVSASAAITYGKLSLTTSIVNGDISNSAAIAYSKLSLTGSIVNADVSATAAIAYSKLSLTGSIVNADISATAAIALSKLATDPLARANHTGTQTASTISDFDTQVRTSRLDQMATPTADVSFGTKKITSLADPTSNQDGATKKYVDDTTTAGAPDASTTVKGLVQLAGDLTGTATSPQLATDSVDTAEIKAGAVDTSEIKDGAVTAAKVNAEVWTAYTPTWTAPSGSPAIGNGTITGAYIQLGKVVHFRLLITAGSTTTFGTGGFRYGLPVQAKVSTSRSLLFPAMAFDNSASQYYPGLAFMAGTATEVATVSESNRGTFWGGSTSIPFAWATSDTISINGTYEAN